MQLYVLLNGHNHNSDYDCRPPLFPAQHTTLVPKSSHPNIIANPTSPHNHASISAASSDTLLLLLLLLLSEWHARHQVERVVV